MSSSANTKIFKQKQGVILKNKYLLNIRNCLRQGKKRYPSLKRYKKAYPKQEKQKNQQLISRPYNNKVANNIKLLYIC